MIGRAVRLAVLILLVGVSAWAQPKPVTGVHVAAPLVAPPISGLNCADATTRCVPSEYATIDACANAASAGDTCLVSAGTYIERVTPVNSGTAGNTITLVASGTVTFCGVDLTSDSYIRFIGFTVDGDAGGCSAATRAIFATGTNTGIEFWHNTVRDEGSGLSGNAYSDRNQNWIVIGNAILNVGTAMSLFGSNHIIAYNEMGTINPDAIIGVGANNRWLNNYMHDMSDAGGHSDVLQTFSHQLGLSNNLFEGNYSLGTGTLADEHGVLIQHQGGASCEGQPCGAVTENLFRYNVWHNTSGGQMGVDQATDGTITDTRILHESYVDAQRQSPSAAYGVSFNGTGITGWVFNSIFHRAWAPSVTSNVRGFWATGGGSMAGANYNLSFSPDNTPSHTTPWTDQSNPQTNVDPVFVSLASDDFRLQSGSGAIAVGGPVTTTSGSGTGTTFNVQTNTAGFFRGDTASIAQYGGALAAGDVITVGTDTVTITSISTDAITVSSSFTWANADPVYLGTDTTPDIGAYPYKAGGYTLSATYSCNGTTCTITPNDASLVRFVVCSSDGVPYAVDNASTYSCTDPLGTFSARVYARYASTTRWATATP